MLHVENRKFPVTEVMLLCVAVFWGTSYGITKSALVYTSVFMFMAIRFLLTFAILLYPAIKDFRKQRGSDWPVALPTGVILFCIFCCEIVGISKTTATNAAFLISLSVIFTVFLEVVINRRPFDRLLFMLCACSMVGVYMMTSKEGFSLALNMGDCLILVAAVLRALMVTVTKRITEGKTISTLSLTALQSLVVGTGAVVVMIAQNWGATAPVIPADFNFWLLTIYLVLFCTLFAFYVQNYAVRRISPAKASLLMGSEPVFGALFAFVWLGESLDLVQSLGAAIIIFCVYLATIKIKM